MPPDAMVGIYIWVGVNKKIYIYIDIYFFIPLPF